MDDGLLTDTTSRNALYKVHVSLGKIVNALDEQQPANLRASTRSSASAATERLPTEERTVAAGEPETIVEEDGEEHATALPKKEEASEMDEGMTDNGEDTQM